MVDFYRTSIRVGRRRKETGGNPTLAAADALISRCRKSLTAQHPHLHAAIPPIGASHSSLGACWSLSDKCSVQRLSGAAAAPSAPSLAPRGFHRVPFALASWRCAFRRLVTSCDAEKSSQTDICLNWFRGTTPRRNQTQALRQKRVRHKQAALPRRAPLHGQAASHRLS